MLNSLYSVTVERSLATQKLAGSNFDSRPVRFQVTALGKLLTRVCLCH